MFTYSCKIMNYSPKFQTKYNVLDVRFSNNTFALLCTHLAEIHNKNQGDNLMRREFASFQLCCNRFIKISSVVDMSIKKQTCQCAFNGTSLSTFAGAVSDTKITFRDRSEMSLSSCARFAS